MSVSKGRASTQIHQDLVDPVGKFAAPYDALEDVMSCNVVGSLAGATTTTATTQEPIKKKLEYPENTLRQLDFQIA